MTFGNATLRGGQTLLHDVHMWGQLVRWGIIGLLLTIVLVPVIGVWRTTSAHEWRVVGLGVLAEAKLGLGYSPDSRQAYEWREGARTSERIALIAADPRIERIRRRLLGAIHAKAWLGLWIGLGGILLCALAFWFLGRRLARAQRVRGAEMTSAGALGRRVQPLSSRLAEALLPAARRATPRIAGIPWPEQGSPGPSAPRPSTPSSRAPRVRARPS